MAAAWTLAGLDGKQQAPSESTKTEFICLATARRRQQITVLTRSVCTGSLIYVSNTSLRMHRVTVT